MPPFQKFSDCLKTEVNGQWNYSYGTPHWKSTAHEIPETKDIVLVDSKLGSLGDIGRASTNMSFGDECSISDSQLGILWDEPLFAALGVEGGLGSGEGLRVHQNQRLFGVQALIWRKVP
jgi:hypothetical protein